MLVKYRFSAAPVRPFLCGGGALNRLTKVSEKATVGRKGLFDSDIRYSSSSSSSAGELQKKTAAGIVWGGGAEYKVGALRIAPELRCTWWTSRNFGLPGPALLSSSQKHVEFLVSFGF